MGREKIKHLFNKNHIEILKIEDPTFPIFKYPSYEEVLATSYNYKHFLWDSQKEVKVITKKSNLGFYYKSKVDIPNKGSNFKGGSSKIIITYPIPGEKNSYYRLIYYTRYGENQIGREDGLRPWDIYPGDKNFPDNMLESLINEVTSFFAIAEAGKINMFYKNHSKTGYSISSMKKSVFEDLFGNENGPRFQTDMEKILAHGFDPKYSFRKDKEKK